MNYFEFKKILDSDPFSEDPDFRNAINNDLKCRKSYNDAMAQEKLFKMALNISVPSHFKDEVVFNQCNEKKSSHKYNIFAVAASFFAFITIGAFAWQMNKPSELESFINKNNCYDR